MLIVLVLVLCAGAAALLAGCARSPASRPRDTLVVVYLSDADTLNPLYAADEPAVILYSLVFDGLTALGPHFRVIPRLATAWSSSPDHLHWDVELRRGVRWSDGATFDARDVVFTWRTTLDPKVGCLLAGQFDYVRRVSALSPQRVRFDLRAPNVLFATQALEWPILPAHLLAKIPPAQQLTSDFGEHPIGTGPYALASWHHDDAAIFTRNPNWWGGTANIRTIAFEIVLDGGARVEAMADGSADLDPDLTPADDRRMRAVAPQLTYYRAPDLFSYFIQTNDTVAGLNDVDVRRAMLYGWDRRAAADGLFHGGVRVNNSLTAWALPQWHADGLLTYDYDPTRARELLDAAGWRPGRDGVRTRGGRRLAFTLKLPSGSTTNVDLCAAFQADMRAIGIAVDIQLLDYASFIDQVNAMRYELAYTGWGGTPDPDVDSFLDSAQMVPNGNNATGYRNARVDRDLRTGLTSFDQRRRRAIYDDYQRITNATVPVLFGFDETFNAAYSARLHLDARSELPDLYFFWDVASWSLTS